MTPFDLLELIGEADEKYVLPAGKKKKKSVLKPILVAAVFALVILGGGRMLLGNLRMGSSVNSTAATAEPRMAADEFGAEAASPAEAPAEAEVEAQAEEATEETAVQENATDGGEQKPAEVYDSVTLLGAAEIPVSPDAMDFDARYEIWTENETSEALNAALCNFSYKTAAEILEGSEKSGAYSPMSLYQALAILASGAEQETQRELLNLLGMENREELLEQAGKLYRRNHENSTEAIMEIYNSIWLDDEASDGTSVNYHQDWVLEASEKLYADVYAADFSNPETPGALGSWIAEHTGGLLQPGQEELGIGEETNMAILNTIYYCAPWNDPFQPEENTEDTFVTEDGDSVTAEFMHKTEGMTAVYHGENYLLASLSVADGMVTFVLPDEGVSLDELLTAEKLEEIDTAIVDTDAEIHWSIPKFDTASNFDLQNALQMLGVNESFGTDADFSRIAENPLSVSSIRQGTRFTLDETGVKAAGFTAFTMEGAGEPVEYEIVDMNLNRPFLYMVSSRSDAPLFIGTVRNPAE